MLQSCLLSDAPSIEHPCVPTVSSQLRSNAWFAQLERDGALSRSIIETTGEGVCIVDPELRIAFVNTQLAAMLGHSVSEMTGAHVCTFLDAAGTRIAARSRQRAAEGASGQHQLRIRRKGEGELWVLLTTSGWFDDSGAYAGTLAILRDMTAIKRAEDAAERAREEIERRVAERTRELLEANQKLAELASRDPLTGLLNRRALDERLAGEAARATRYAAPLSLLMIDVDHFKVVNDTLGHAAGDQVLRHVAGLLANGLRASDVLARYGGEEFVILAPHTSPAGSIVLAERLRATLAATPCSAGGDDFAVTISIGLSTLGVDADSASALVRNADQAMYRAKECGRDCVSRLTDTAEPAADMNRKLPLP